MIILRFLKLIGKTINAIRLVLVNFIMLAIIVFFVYQINNQPSNLKEDSVLLINLEGSIVDTSISKDGIFSFGDSLGDKPNLKRENSLFEIIDKIRKAKSDNKIRGILLKLDNLVSADITSLEYLSKYLQDFKKVKPIYAVGSSYNKTQYYLASNADKIYLNSFGIVNLDGISYKQPYYRSLLDFLSINAHVFRVGEYKSAVEPYLLDQMSAEAKEDANYFVGNLWNNYVSGMSLNRNIPAEQVSPPVQNYIEKVKASKGDLTDYALKNKLVDHVAPIFKTERMLNEAFNNLPYVSIYDYINLDDNAYLAKNKIVALTVEGAINQGKSNSGVAGSATITGQINDIANDSSVAAVVIKVNSPGGSVIASEEIRSSIEMLKEKNIPVVVSMGGMAASGGYWISTAADYVFANKSTITGSIGIFGLIPTFENSLSKIGVNFDGVQTSALAGNSVFTGLTDEYKTVMQLSVENGYQQFIKLVSDTRGIAINDVDKLARGKIWLGAEAKKYNLVDELGDFDDAVAKAANLAGITEYHVEWQKKQISTFDQIFGQYSASILTKIETTLPFFKMAKHTAIMQITPDAQNRYVLCQACLTLQ